jgi:hypothetical protein
MEAHTGAKKARSEAIETHPGAIEALKMAPWRLILGTVEAHL